VLTANAVALALLLAFQRSTGESELPWPLSVLTDRAGLTASFVYHNHAGAYLGLMTFTAIALATWSYDQGLRTQKKSTPAAVLALVSFFIGISVLFTLSRAASLFLGGAFAAFAGWIYLRHRFRPTDSGTDSRVTIALTAGFVIFFLYVGYNIDFSAISSRFDVLVSERSKDWNVSSRIEARDSGLALLADHGWRGVGAGGFRYVFPEYAQRHPDIVYFPKLFGPQRLFWEHVHNDWLEIPIELGAVGVLLLLAIAGFWVRLFFQCRTAWHSAPVLLLMGCAGTLLHAGMDFPFQCPAILVTWCLLVTMAGRRLVAERVHKA